MPLARRERNVNLAPRPYPRDTRWLGGGVAINRTIARRSIPRGFDCRADASGDPGGSGSAPASRFGRPKLLLLRLRRARSPPHRHPSLSHSDFPPSPCRRASSTISARAAPVKCALVESSRGKNDVRLKSSTIPLPTSKVVMPATAMFSNLKSRVGGGSAGVQNILDHNPIAQHFEIGKQTASAGPELVWRIHDAYRKSDGKEVSVFVFEKKCAEKLHKPKRKETVTELLRSSVRQLERFRHPKILQVVHSVEESGDTLAFASEPVLGSLANILAYQEGIIGGGGMGGGGPPSALGHMQAPRHSHAREYHFLDIELKYGILQITEALSFLHYTGHVLHRNVCPSSILVTKKGTWKLGGLEFTERMNELDGLEPVSCQPWSSRVPKMAQPDLDFIAPEVQTMSQCSIKSDMFSLGMVISAIFNMGRPLIMANHSSSQYVKQLELLEDQVNGVLTRIPIPLQEAVVRLLSKDPKQRPTAQLLTLIKYFR
ncbi:protein kinase activity [Nesidiocoris tenuis]|uniref:Protein kinase activity n=1 Tax=Nesidiocoris tenuis TaxID=355587 RepID=A0ABN7B682_9HEMI|nr:protein kinase activity [Nesidiocoris tenuis]